jgi:hypothetical protein
MLSNKLVVTPSYVNILTRHMFIASSVNIIDRLAGEHKLVQELGEC